MITLWEFQHSTHTAAQPGDMHTTTNYWLCSHHESLSYEQECPSSFPYSSSPPATPLFLRILQTVLPYTWVRPLTTWKAAASPPKFQTWKTLLRACAQAQAFFTCYTKGRSQGKVTAQLSPKVWMWRPWAAWAPLPLVSQVLRLLQSTQGYSGGQSSKGATKPPKEKKTEFCLHKIQLNKSGQICT